MKLRFWKNRLPKQSCLTCQFLSKTLISEVIGKRFSAFWTQDERNNRKIVVIPGEPEYVHCFHKKWIIKNRFKEDKKLAEELTALDAESLDSGLLEELQELDSNLELKLEKELKKNRKDCNPYLQFDEDRDMETALDLHPTEIEDRKFGTTNRLVKIGIVTSFAGTLLTIIALVILHFLE